MLRRIIAYKNHFVDFYKSQEFKVQEKIEYVFDLIRFEKQVPKKFFKRLENTDGILKYVLLRLLKASGYCAFSTKGN
jgi:hypothetical protein